LPPKGIALLVMLAIESSRRYSREYLARLFWPDSTSSKSRDRLRQLLHIVRSAIGDLAGGTDAEPRLAATRFSVQFAFGANCRCDARLLLDATLICKRCLHGEDSCEHCTGELGMLLDLYKGDLFGGEFPWISTEFSEWEQELRQRLRRRAKLLCNRVTECFVKSGRYEAAATFAERYVEIDPGEQYGYQRLSEVYSKLNWADAASGAIAQRATLEGQCNKPEAHPFARRRQLPP
jgi:DNA-binding SARP family transcriptional activator